MRVFVHPLRRLSVLRTRQLVLKGLYSTLLGLGLVVGFHIMHPLVIFGLFLVKRAPNEKILLHFDYIYDSLSIKINVEMVEMLL